MLAAIGFMASLGISRVPAADPGKKLNFDILGEIWDNLRVMKADRDLWRATGATPLSSSSPHWCRSISHFSPRKSST